MESTYKRCMASCARKEIRYSTEEQARAKLPVLLEAKKHIGLDVYACEFCEGWHIGHRLNLKAWCHHLEYILKVADEVIRKQNTPETKSKAYHFFKWCLVAARNEKIRKSKSALRDIGKEKVGIRCRDVGITYKEAFKILQDMLNTKPKRS